MAASPTQTKSPSRRKAAVVMAQSDASRIDAAVLMAARNVDEGAESLTDQQIAERVGVSRSTITRWKRDPEFNALMGDAEGDIKAAALRVPSAQIHNRIKSLDKLAGNILKAIDLRAATYAAIADSPEEAARQVFGSETPPWAATGVYIAKKKISASGKTVTDWELDRASIDAIDRIYQHIAKQLGQWSEKSEISGPDGVALTVVLAERADGPQ